MLRAASALRRAASTRRALAAACLAAVVAAAGAQGSTHRPPSASDWTPTEAIELIVPAGTDGSADQMARLIQSIAQRYRLLKQPLTVVNLQGDTGAEAFLHVRAATGDPHKLVITLSNLFTTPVASGLAFHWRELTPVALLALDPFVLWVNAASPQRSARDFVAAVKAAPPQTLRIGGTGQRQEDRLITVMMENALGRKLAYVPFGGGGEVARRLVQGQVDATVNNPIEAELHWQQGHLRPLCVFDAERLPYPARLSQGRSWQDIPPCPASGLDVSYVMMRGIFMAPGVTPQQQAFWVNLLGKVRATPEWRAFMERGAYRQAALSGPAFVEWVDRNERMHRELMHKSGLAGR